MIPDHHKRGGAAVGVLSKMDAWEAGLIQNLRLWCDGPHGQAHVWNAFRASMPGAQAETEMRCFDALVTTLTQHASRPLVRHDVGCSCAGADECAFAHLIGLASDGHLNDAALMASLLVGPGHAEQVAILAGQVGACARQMADDNAETHPDNVVPFRTLH